MSPVGGTASPTSSEFLSSRKKDLVNFSPLINCIKRVIDDKYRKCLMYALFLSIYMFNTDVSIPSSSNAE